jgi:CRP-like cAMP-binding protein
MGTERLTADDRAAFHGYLRRSAPLGDADLAAVEADTRVRQLPARTVFLASGELAVDCGTVLDGLVREYFPLEDGREVTRGFSGPGDHVGSLSDLLSGRPALSSVIAEVDTRIAVVPWRRIRELVVQRPAWAELLAQVTRRLYLAKAAREYELLALDAEARYHRFRTVYAALEPSIPLRDVASYVGITAEHLSRLRRRLGMVEAPGRGGPPARRRVSLAHLVAASPGTAPRRR